MATSRGCNGGSEILVEPKRAKRRRLCVRPTDHDFACPYPFLYGCGHVVQGINEKGRW